MLGRSLSASISHTNSDPFLLGSLLSQILKTCEQAQKGLLTFEVARENEKGKPGRRVFLSD